MATLAVETPDLDGLDATYNAAAGGGDEFANDGRVILHVKNGGGGSVDVTVTSQRTDGDPIGTTSDDSVTSVPNGEDRFIGPFLPAAFNDADGLVQVGYSGVTSVTVAVLSL